VRVGGVILKCKTATRWKVESLGVLASKTRNDHRQLICTRIEIRN